MSAEELLNDDISDLVHRERKKQPPIVLTMEDMDRLIIVNEGTAEQITLGEYVQHKIDESLRCLSLEVDESTTSNYTGGMNGRSLYEDSKSVKIRLTADIDDQTTFVDEIEFDV